MAALLRLWAVIILLAVCRDVVRRGNPSFFEAKAGSVEQFFQLPVAGIDP